MKNYKAIIGLLALALICHFPAGVLAQTKFNGYVTIALKDSSTAQKKATIKKAFNVHFYEGQIMVDSVNMQGQTLKVIIDQTNKQFKILLPGPEKNGLLVGFDELMGLASQSYARKKSIQEDSAELADIDLQFMRQKKQKKIAGQTVIQYKLAPKRPDNSTKDRDTLILWVAENAPMKLTDFTPIYNAVKDQPQMQVLLNMFGTLPDKVKNGMPLEIDMPESGWRYTVLTVQRMVKTGTKPEGFDTSEYNFVPLKDYMRR